MKRYSADWGWGLLAGTLFGIALAMLFVDLDWITPESPALRYTAGASIVGACLVVAARNWFQPRNKHPQDAGQ